MKKDENSNICIKQIISTAIVLFVAVFGGLNAYGIVCDKNVDTIQNIESADTTGDSFETALVENTEEDVIFSTNIKYLAVNVIEPNDVSGDGIVSPEQSEELSYLDKVISRGNYLREQANDEFLSGFLGQAKNSGNVDGIEEENNGEDKVTSVDEVMAEKTVESPVESTSDLTAEVPTESTSDLTAEASTESTSDLAEEVPTESTSGLTVEVPTESTSGLTVEVPTESTSDLAEEVPAESAVDLLTPPTEYIKTIDVKATAYCLCKKCCGKSPSNPGYGITASGLKIIPGTGMKVVASDPSVIPLGTKVYIEGLYGAKDYGYAVVADTGSAIKNLKIDLYMDTHQMALNWGVKTVRVYILADS